jgi:hypothetical protein
MKSETGMVGNITDPRVADVVGQVFGAASHDVRKSADASIAAETRGERGTREDSYTDRLIDRMRSAIRARLEELSANLSNSGVTVDVRFTPTNLPVGDEFTYGADIGIRVRIQTQDFLTVKGVLVQCKRMYGPKTVPTFAEIRERGEDQARKMLRVTPASFFMLYNFGDQQDLLAVAGIPTGMVCPGESGGPVPNPVRSQPGRCVVWGGSSGTIWDMGIAVTPASRILALSASAAKRGVPMPIEADQILRGALPLGCFVTDLLASCFVGDVRAEVVRLVTPPAERDAAPASVGLPRDDFAGFAVRQYMDVTIAAAG